MSTPPFVALPRGVQRRSFAGGFAPLAGLIAEPEGPAKGTALLIPGFTGSKEDFIADLPLLAEAGWRIASFDLRGQHESAGPGEPDGYRLTEFVSDAIGVCHELHELSGQPVQLLGHSFGGLVARAAAAELAADPRRAGVLGSLTLLASGPGALPPAIQVMASQLLDVLPDVPLQTIWDIKEALEREAGAVAGDPDIEAFMHWRFISNNPHALAGKARILISLADTVDADARILRDAGLPLLVAYGQDDTRWTTAEQDLMARRLNARRFLFPRTAHSPGAEHPYWFAAAMNAFWSDAQRCEATALSQNAELPMRFGTVPRGYEPGMELRLPVEFDPGSVSLTRHAIKRQLQAWNITEQIDDLQLVVSELVTNAIRYGSGPIELTLTINPTSLRVAVADTNAEDLPASRTATMNEFTGRGVPLIEAISSSWGVEEVADGKIVWAEIAIQAA